MGKAQGRNKVSVVRKPRVRLDKLGNGEAERVVQKRKPRACEWGSTNSGVSDGVREEVILGKEVNEASDGRTPSTHGNVGAVE
jgi:hypothetical protein